MREPLSFERSSKGRAGWTVRPASRGEVRLEPELRRREPALLPRLSEPEVVRHFVRLSHHNYGIETGFFPLGSCTMKHNPRMNEELAGLPGFVGLHPHTPDEACQGALELMWRLERALAVIGGMDAVSLQPAAGAQGELTGMAVIRAWLSEQGNPRKRVLVPDTAHGTNPATCTLNGYTVTSVPSGEDGRLHPEAVAEHMADDVAALMVTNPNTLGVFETRLPEITQVVHDGGGLVYCDGANLNAILGRTTMGLVGVDVMHFNLHKTFSTPHGGGGPGSGPVAVRGFLEPYLPVPRIDMDLKTGYFRREDTEARSIGRVHGFFGNFGIFVRAYAYILRHGPEGLRDVADMAVLNSRYLRSLLEDVLPLATDSETLHECVFLHRRLKAQGVKTMDIAKGLIDEGFHPYTVAFPICVDGAMMVEPTETETRESLDAFAAAMRRLVERAETEPEYFATAPAKTPVSRPDEAGAARRPVLVWQPEQ